MPKGNEKSHLDRYLTNWSIEYAQSADKFVAGSIFPTVPVEQKSDTILVYDRGSMWRDNVEERPLGGHPVGVDYTYGDTTYSCKEYGLEHSVDDRTRQNTDAPINLDKNATLLLTQQHLIRKDRFWVQTYYKDSIWGKDLAGVDSNPSATQFLKFNQTGSDPIEIIDQIKEEMEEATGYMPNTMVLSADVLRVLKNSPSLISRIQYTQRGVITLDLLASLLELNKIVVPRAIYNSAAEGAKDAFSYIAPKGKALLAYVEPNIGLNMPTAGATFSWNGLMPGMQAGNGAIIERYRESRNHSDVFQARSAWGMELIAPDLGVFLSDCI